MKRRFTSSKSSLSDAVREQICESFGYPEDNPEFEFIVEWLESIENTIKTEALKHYD